MSVRPSVNVLELVLVRSSMKSLAVPEVKLDSAHMSGLSICLSTPLYVCQCRGAGVGTLINGESSCSGGKTGLGSYVLTLAVCLSTPLYLCQCRGAGVGTLINGESSCSGGKTGLGSYVLTLSVNMKYVEWTDSLCCK